MTTQLSESLSSAESASSRGISPDAFVNIGNIHYSPEQSLPQITTSIWRIFYPNSIIQTFLPFGALCGYAFYDCKFQFESLVRDFLKIQRGDFKDTRSEIKKFRKLVIFPYTGFSKPSITPERCIARML